VSLHFIDVCFERSSNLLHLFLRVVCCSFPCLLSASYPQGRATWERGQFLFNRWFSWPILCNLSLVSRARAQSGIVQSASGQHKQNFLGLLEHCLGVSSRKLRYSYRKLVAHTKWHVHEHVSEAFGKKCMPQALFELPLRCQCGDLLLIFAILLLNFSIEWTTKSPFLRKPFMLFSSRIGSQNTRTSRNFGAAHHARKEPKSRDGRASYLALVNGFPINYASLESDFVSLLDMYSPYTSISIGALVL